MQTQFASVNEAIEYLRIPRSTFFRLKKQGKIRVEALYKGNTVIYNIYRVSAERPIVTSESDGPIEGGSIMAVEPVHSSSQEVMTQLIPLQNHAQYLDEWILWREQGLYTRPWSKEYKRNSLLYIKKYFARWEVISSQHLETWLTETPVMQKTLRVHKHAPVSSFAKFLVHKGVLSRDEYRKIRDLYPKKSPYYHPKQRIIYEEDLETILEAASKDGGYHPYNRFLNVTIIRFLSATALRAKEMCDLKLSDLHFSDKPNRAFVHVRCGKGGKERYVPFTLQAQEAIREYLKHRPNVDDDRLFWAFNPKHGYVPISRDCVVRRMKHVSDRSGIPFSAHSFRHYRITRWANSPKIPITMVQLWAGHSSLIVTQRYIHTRNEEALAYAFQED